MWYAKVPKFPEFPSVKNGVWEALKFFFSASVQELGMRLPVNTFWLCAYSDAMHLLSPAPQYCILQYSVLWMVGNCIYSVLSP